MAWWQSQSSLAGLSDALDEFITAVLMNTEERYLRNGAHERLAQRFVYGAVGYLADYDGLDTAQTQALLQSKMNQHFQVDQDDFVKLKAEVKALSQSDEDYSFLVEGARALQRWINGRDRMNASLTLNTLLKDRIN